MLHLLHTKKDENRVRRSDLELFILYVAVISIPYEPPIFLGFE